MSFSFVHPGYLWLLLILPIMLSLGFAGQRRTSRFRFWGGLSLRTIIVICIIFALASIQLKLRSDLLTTVFIFDVSDSIQPPEQARGAEFIRQAIRSMSEIDRAAIILFGKDALVERLASEAPLQSEFTSIPVTTRTDIASALQLAQAILPDEGSKRIVLLSDGRENLGVALQQAEISAANHIELEYVPLGIDSEGVEVYAENLESPPDIHQGEQIVLNANIHSTAQVKATLRLFSEGELIQSREVSIQPGTNRFQLDAGKQEMADDSPASGDIRRFRIQILPDVDTRLQNNDAYAFSVVHGPPNVLIVEGQADEGRNLEDALTAAEMKVKRINPGEVPTSLSEMAGYQAVVLVDVSAAQLPIGVMDILPVYVRELGMGLLMIGGQDGFGAGGYIRTPLEEALPVNMDIKNREFQANIALVLAVDKSGSMGRCHCDNPDLNQTYTRAEAGQPKVDIAKEAIMRAAGALGDQDYLGVVAFDSDAHWAVRLMPLINQQELENAISPIQAVGSTNLGSGVEAAFKALEDVPAQRKHIILLTDGWVRQGDLTNLAETMKSQGVTLSVIAAGRGSAEYLETLAQEGGGRYYPATDMLSVPDIFLKETIESVGQYVIEEPFTPIPAAPSSVMRGIELAKMPPLLGYNGTSSKSTARLDLITPRGDPLLATWQYGLGRSAAWTSDLKGQWGTQWINWGDFPRFAGQLVGWILPAPRVEGLEVRTNLEDNQVVIHLKAVDKNGSPLNFLTGQATVIRPDLQSETIPLKQTGAGLYDATYPVDSPGIFLIRVGVNQGDQSLGQLTSGIVVPYSPEYKANGPNLSLLSQLAVITGGKEQNIPSAAFIHNLPVAVTSREIWQPLLFLAALLFPLDVAIRRLVINRGDLKKFKTWFRSRIPQSTTERQNRPRILDPLFQARERARSRQNLKQDPAGKSALKENLSSDETGAHDLEANVPPSRGTDDRDSLARLREAKKRAQR